MGALQPMRIKPPLHIHQIYFRPEQKQLLSPLFIPYFKPENEEREWREYWTFTKNAPKVIKSKGLTGYISWKFEQKSKIPAEKFIRFIRDNPGHDVYFLNPFPLDAQLFDNVWRHGEFYHPGLMAMTQQILDKLKYRINLQNLRHDPAAVGYSNYWVGNGKFWKAYMDFTRPVAEYIRNKATAEEREFIYSIADPVSNCSHIPFVFERMFTTLLVSNPQIRYTAYTYDADDVKRRYNLINCIAINVLGDSGRWTSVLLRNLVRRIILVMRSLQKLRNHRQ